MKIFIQIMIIVLVVWAIYFSIQYSVKQERICIDVKKLKEVSLSTFLFMSVSYMHAWTNNNLLFDAVGLQRSSSGFELAVSDRYLISITNYLDGGHNLAWLCGILSTIFMIVSVYCLTDVFCINKTINIIMVAGVCVTNTSIISLQQYTGGGNAMTLALMFASLSLYFFYSTRFTLLIRLIVSACFFFLSAAMYGAYMSVVPAVMLFCIIKDILEGKSGRENWIKSIGCFCTVCLGALLYFIGFSLIKIIKPFQIEPYMGKENLNDVSGCMHMIEAIPRAYGDLYNYYFGTNIFMPLKMVYMQRIIVIVTIILFVYYCFCIRKQIVDKVVNGFLLGIVLALLPAAINLICIVSSGNVHYLMIFTYCIPLLAGIRDMELFYGKSKWMFLEHINAFLSVVLCCFIFSGCVLANVVNVHYTMMAEEAQSISTRLVDRIESSEGFLGNETVILFGELQNNSYFHAYSTVWPSDELLAWVGPQANSSNAICYSAILIRYMKGVYNSSLNFERFIDQEDGFVDAEKDVFANMPMFPADGSVVKKGNKIYVKLSE